MRGPHGTSNAELAGIICSGSGAFIGALSKAPLLPKTIEYDPSILQSCFKLSWLLEQREERRLENQMRIDKIQSPTSSTHASPEKAENSSGQDSSEQQDPLTTPGWEALELPANVEHEATSFSTLFFISHHLRQTRLLDSGKEEGPVSQGPLILLCPTSPWTVFWLGICIAPMEVATPFPAKHNA